MNEQTQSTLAAVLSLPPDQQIALVEAILESLSEDEDESADGELLDELDRRRSEAAQGEPGIPWSVLREEQ